MLTVFHAHRNKGGDTWVTGWERDVKMVGQGRRNNQEEKQTVTIFNYLSSVEDRLEIHT
jgi:hypothetical protein